MKIDVSECRKSNHFEEFFSTTKLLKLQKADMIFHSAVLSYVFLCLSLVTNLKMLNLIVQCSMSFYDLYCFNKKIPQFPEKAKIFATVFPFLFLCACVGGGGTNKKTSSFSEMHD